ncbi:MAG: hypothetical protein RJA91_115 [Pseudomonadota bacterium]|jgi:hypothetical protein
MTPVKFIKVKENAIDYDIVTLINILSIKDELLYFFICEYDVTHNGITTNQKELMQFDDYEFEIINENYKIV